jgi:subtilase family serine protease
MRKFTILLLLPAALFAQKDRIAGSIDSRRVAAIKGNIAVDAQPEFDEGPVDPSTVLNYVTLTLKTSPAQQADLNQLLRDQQDPFSPNFRKWLTPEQYADRFGASPEDLDKIAFWLQSEGLEIITKARGRRWIAFNATAGQIKSTLRTEIHRYRVNGELHFANATEPSIPEAIQEMVLMVDGLNDFHGRHMAIRKLPSASEHTDTTTANGTHQLAPGDVRTIYDTTPLYNKGITGAGQKIVIIDRSDVLLSDISLFRSTFGLPASTPQRVLVPGSTNPGITSDNAETNLDLDWAGAIAPNAQLIYVFAPSEYTAVTYAIDQALAPVISYSYYPCEQAQSGSVSGNVQALAQQANAQGITWIACSGDAGAESCDYNVAAGTHGVSVSLMAAVPEITGVGGTTFNEGTGRYWGTYNGNANAATALGYIPETSWTGSGGGFSIFYPKPDWQLGVPSTSAGPFRGVPDVAFSADPNHDGYLIFDNGKLEPIGGTSVGTPVFAGMIALLNEYLGTNGLGNINPTLYRLAQSTSTVFHDVTTGNNFHACKSGTPDCSAGRTSVGYSAEPGWDAVTGLGSVDAANLIANWSNGVVGTTTSVAANPSSFTLSSQTTLTATVKSAGSSVTPTGIVSFTFGSTSLGTATLSGSGSTATATLTLYGSQMTSGTDVINVTYGGDKNVNGSTASVTVTVTVPTASSAVIPAISPNPIYQGTPDSQGYAWFYTVQLSEVAGSSTTLTGFSIDGTDYSNSIASFFGTATIPANGSLSASLEAKSLAVPLKRVFVFSGRDSNGRTWTQQATAQFLGAQRSASMALIGAPNIVLQDPTQSSDCQYSQNLGIQEMNGHSVTLTRFLAAGADYTSQIVYFFGSTVLPRSAPCKAESVGISPAIRYPKISAMRSMASTTPATPSPRPPPLTSDSPRPTPAFFPRPPTPTATCFPSRSRIPPSRLRRAWP